MLINRRLDEFHECDTSSFRQPTFPPGPAPKDNLKGIEDNACPPGGTQALKDVSVIDNCEKFVYNSNKYIWMLLSYFILQVGRDDMTEQATEQKETSTSPRLHLLCKELEEATNEFLFKMAELEKLLPLIDE
jgi:hypothetical protein